MVRVPINWRTDTYRSYRAVLFKIAYLVIKNFRRVYSRQKINKNSSIIWPRNSRSCVENCKVFCVFLGVNLNTLLLYLVHSCIKCTSLHEWPESYFVSLYNNIKSHLIKIAPSSNQFIQSWLCTFVVQIQNISTWQSKHIYMTINFSKI